MEVKINKEIREYTRRHFLRIIPKTMLFFLLACVMAVIFYFFIH